MSETKEITKVVELEKLTDLLSALQDALREKRAQINSWDNYGKVTFLAFDSYNLGLTTAMDMLGNTICAITAIAEDAEPLNTGEAKP